MVSRLGCTLLTVVLAVMLAMSIGQSPASAQSSATYAYDPLGRVITSSTAAGTATYTYDNADNRTHLTACVSTCNHPPVAADDNAPVATGGTVVVPVLANDSDPDHDTLIVQSVGGSPAKGTPSVTAGGGSVTYVATAGQTGIDTFNYTISDGHGGTAQATVTITINAAAPIANSSSTTVGYNSSNNPVPLNITGGTPTSVAVATNPTHGTAVASGITISYTPSSNTAGPDSFTYTASNAGGTSAPATVSITISAAPPSPPTVGANSATVAYNSSGNSMPLVLGGGQATGVAVVSQPGRGSATASGLGISYTPTNGLYGSDSFTYNATGPGGTSGTAQISITVSPPAAPNANPVSMTVDFNSLNNPVPISVTGVYTSVGVNILPAKGSANVSGASISYTPGTGQSGADSFSYYAVGPGGMGVPGQVSVTINPGPPSLSAPVNTTSYLGGRDQAGWHPGTPVTVSATGGSGGYTYAWEYVSGDTSILLSSANPSTATWTRGGILVNIDVTAVWRCKVTDSAGAIAYSPNISVEIIEDTGQ
jgi:YD repeat-containing protein